MIIITLCFFEPLFELIYNLFFKFVASLWTHFVKTIFPLKKTKYFNFNVLSEPCPQQFYTKGKVVITLTSDNCHPWTPLCLSLFKMGGRDTFQYKKCLLVVCRLTAVLCRIVGKVWGGEWSNKTNEVNWPLICHSADQCQVSGHNKSFYQIQFPRMFVTVQSNISSRKSGKYKYEPFIIYSI